MVEQNAGKWREYQLTNCIFVITFWINSFSLEPNKQYQVYILIKHSMILISRQASTQIFKLTKCFQMFFSSHIDSELELAAAPIKLIFSSTYKYFGCTLDSSTFEAKRKNNVTEIIFESALAVVTPHSHKQSSSCNMPARPAARCYEYAP